MSSLLRTSTLETVFRPFPIFADAISETPNQGARLKSAGSPWLETVFRYRFLVLLRSQKSVKRLEKTKANMHAVDLQLTTSIATMSTTASLKVLLVTVAGRSELAVWIPLGPKLLPLGTKSLHTVFCLGEVFSVIITGIFTA